MAINKVGVVGAGQMGNGIAHVFALAGYDVMMTDISADALAAAVALIDKNITRQIRSLQQSARNSMVPVIAEPTFDAQSSGRVSL